MVIAQIILDISCVILLLLFYDKSNTVLGAVTLDQLKTVCMYGFPPHFTYDYMPPKEVCSAMGLYSLFQAPNGMKLSVLKQDLPNVYVYYTQCTNFVGSDDTIRFLDESKLQFDFLKTVIKEQNVDVLVLKLLERNLLHAAIPFTVDSYLVSVYKDLKTSKKDLLIGLMLPNSSPNELMVRLKDSLGDLNSFYVIESSDTLSCKSLGNQTVMKPPVSIDHLEKVIKMYNDLDYPAFQTFLTIDVFVTVWEKDTYDINWTISQMCESTSDTKFSYCQQALADLHSQVATIRSRGRFPSLAGVFVNWADFDDWKGTCQCGKFPALRVIDGAVKLISKNETLIGCKTYGQQN